jgi:BirA family biotin operon repressor/biotin-[acetyl-CoA-carboxylase] ligase
MTMRSTILATLRNSQGEWVSGEALSNSLNVSRTTIWKQIKTLIEEGYEVDSSPKKGLPPGCSG